MSEDQLIRRGYLSEATGKRREYLVYLPRGYETRSDWPMIFYLHGGGERGDGLGDLDYVLDMGPLFEAWLRRRELPFVMVAPQLPVFDMHDHVEGLHDSPPLSRGEGIPEHNYWERVDRSILREKDPEPSTFEGDDEANCTRLPQGWQDCETDLLRILDDVSGEFSVDEDRVYLTGISYGGYGTFHMAMEHPHRWAAVAPVCGSGDPTNVQRLAETGTPIWIFAGGRDQVIKTGWVYPVAKALEDAGHPQVNFTVHEDLGHDVFLRVFAGSDIFDWFLSKRRK